jgi:hypothetical protein
VTDPQQQLVDDIAQFRWDPLGFCRYVWPWGEAGTPLADSPGPREWAAEEMQALGEHLRNPATRHDVYRLAIASGHGIAKSATVGMLINWALSTCPDTRVRVTANTETQLTNLTWPEVAKWHSMAINRDWFTFTATSLYNSAADHEKNWRADAVPWSITRSEAFAGLHNQGKRILLVFDEASAIDDKIWEVAEGALTDEGTEIIWIAFGNPTRNTGRFREAFRRHRHLWRHRNIDSRDVEGTDKKQLQQWVDTYGEDSDFVKVRVRGMFPAQSAKQFISTEDVDAAYGRHLRLEQYQFAPKIIGLDPAWTGDDEMWCVLRQGLMSKVLFVMPHNDNDIEVANILAMHEDQEGADAVFIDAGYGTGIFSAGKTMGRKWQLVWFGKKAPDEGCVNMRAYIWREMRDWLKQGGAIPEEQQLYDDLIGPEIKPRTDGKVALESKEDMKKRGLPSPNGGDALALTFAQPVVNRTTRPGRAKQEFATMKRPPRRVRT